MKDIITNRGFQKTEFEDFHGVKCSIQESSMATDDAIWLGIEDPNPIIMKSDAVKMGMSVEEPIEGWMPYKIPDQVLINIRMHLSVEQVEKLLPYLHRFVETGELHAQPVVPEKIDIMKIWTAKEINSPRITGLKEITMKEVERDGETMIEREYVPVFVDLCEGGNAVRMGDYVIMKSPRH